MEYRWSLDILNKLKKEQIYCLRNTSGLLNSDKKILKDNINLIKELENIVSPKTSFINNSPHTKYLDKEKIIPKDTYTAYLSIPKEIRSWILNKMTLFQDLDFSDKETDLPKIKYNHKELIDLVNEFFSWIPNKSYTQIIKRYTNPNEHLLHIRKNSLSEEYNGHTFYLHYPTYIPLILINQTSTILDFLIIVHELAHSICYAFDNETTLSNNHYYLSELEGYFYEYMAIIFLEEKNIVSSKILEQLILSNKYDMIDNFSNFYNTFWALKIYSQHKKLNIENYYKIALEYRLESILDFDFLPHILESNCVETTKYIISYLTYLDLINSNDLEESFRDFESIRFNKTNNIKENLIRNGITFFDKNDNLKRVLKK